MAEMFPQLDSSTAGGGVGTGTMPTSGITWQQILQAFGGGNSTASLAANNMAPFAPLQGGNVNKGIPMLNTLQGIPLDDAQKQQTSADDVSKYIKFFQGLFV